MKGLVISAVLVAYFAIELQSSFDMEMEVVGRFVVGVNEKE